MIQILELTDKYFKIIIIETLIKNSENIDKWKKTSNSIELDSIKNVQIDII